MSGRNGVQRVVMIYRPENFLNALKEYKDVLGITDFEGPYDLDSIGLRVAMSWNTGLELITPMAAGTYSEAMWEILRSKGEGMFNLVYQVEDLEAAERRATAHGRPRAGDYIDALEVQNAWRERFRIAREAPLVPVAGVAVTLIQIETKSGDAVRP